MSRVSPQKPSLQSSRSPGKHGISGQQTRPSKRARMSGAQDHKENKADNTLKVGSLGLSDETKVRKQSKDEQALLDELMAGLDASIFDHNPSSPVTSQKLFSPSLARSSQKSFSPTGRDRNAFGLDHLGIQERRTRVVLSPTKPNIPLGGPPRGRGVTSENPSAKLESQAENQNPLPVEDHSCAQEASFLTVKDEEKDLFDDELFEFDFDLTDVAGINDDVLFAKPEPKVQEMTNPSAQS